MRIAVVRYSANDAASFINRLIAAIPPPKFHLLRYFGVISSHSALRAEVVPGQRLMGPAGPGLEWTAAAVIDDDANHCDKTAQDDVAELQSSLGAHVPRPAVPLHADTSPPQISFVPVSDGDSLDPSSQLCLSASDDSMPAWALLQVVHDFPGIGPRVVAQQFALTPPYQFDPVALAGANELRFYVADGADHINERRVKVELLPGAPMAAPCPN